MQRRSEVVTFRQLTGHVALGGLKRYARAIVQLLAVDASRDLTHTFAQSFLAADDVSP